MRDKRLVMRSETNDERQELVDMSEGIGERKWERGKERGKVR